MSHRFSSVPSARQLALAAGLLALAGCAGGEASKYAGNWSRDLSGEGEVKMNLASNGGVELMLHADHTYDKHAWYPRLVAGERRGLGAELRLFGVDPDAVEARARRAGAPIVQAVATKGHGWREVMVEDPDGYLWAVGIPTPPDPVGPSGGSD